MDSLKLYLLLQGHVAKLNHLVIGLYKEEITAEEALKTAKMEIEKLKETLSAENE